MFNELLTVNNVREVILENGVMLFQFIFGDIDENLREQRLKKYNKMTTDVHLKTTMKAEYLPTTESAVEQHILRSYLQYKDWVLLSFMTLPPTEIEAYGPFGPVLSLAEMPPPPPTTASKYPVDTRLY